MSLLKLLKSSSKPKHFIWTEEGIYIGTFSLTAWSMIPFTCNRKCWISFRCYICIAVLLDFCVTSTIHISTTSNCLPPKQYWLLLSCDWLTMFYISSDFCLSCRMAKSFHFWTNGCGQRTAIAADGEGIQNHWVTALHLVCSLHIPYSFQFHLFFKE